MIGTPVRVAVVVPCHRVRDQILDVLARIGDETAAIYVVDDGCPEGTGDVVEARVTDPRVRVIRHEQNRGVGAAVITGYQAALDDGATVIVKIDGDGQMDPADLPRMIAPILEGSADYVKGNRFKHPDIWRAMPPVRIVGNVVLSTLTKLTIGYRHVFDSQCGYTAIHRRALAAIDLDGLFPRYGYPNDLLARLHVAGMRVTDVPVRPIYGPHWKSGIHLGTAVHPISWVLLRSWGTRVTAEARARQRARLAARG